MTFLARVEPATALVLLLATAPAAVARDAEDIEFVQEHIAEVPMDNRFAILPVWNSVGASEQPWSFAGQAATAKTTVGNLQAAGPMFSVAASRTLGRGWSLGALVFYDKLDLTGDRDVRPLQTRFSPNTPFERPVLASFDDLDGRMRHYGGGLHFALDSDSGWLGVHRWVGGVLWQRVELRDYRLTYRLLEGPSTGLTGQIDFDADYSHVTPFAGLELPRIGERWAFSPHLLAAMPIPRRAVVGHITGPGFDLRGDTAEAGAGKHFGDPSVTLGLDVTYLPARLSVDIGTLLTQRLVEPVIHRGIEANWVLSCQWRF